MENAIDRNLHPFLAEHSVRNRVFEPSKNEYEGFGAIFRLETGQTLRSMENAFCENSSLDMFDQTGEKSARN